jgi:hypothetical protein
MAHDPRRELKKRTATLRRNIAYCNRIEVRRGHAITGVLVFSAAKAVSFSPDFR